ncbi:MAG: hypothetical protein ACI9MR_005152 [Myxococcota bacterium]|jgi:hypothetical protein
MCRRRLTGARKHEAAADERDGDAIVESALDVECLANAHGNPGTGHDRLTQGGVGRRQNGRQQQ